MAKAKTAAAKNSAELPIPAALERSFDENLHVIYRAVHREFANPRSGSASTKRRDEVSGGGRKPWRQKGTGRARQGSIRSPQWRHGGVTFGPKPRSYVEALNKRERRLAFMAALAERFKHHAVSLLDAAALDASKTAEFAKSLFGTAKAAKHAPLTLIVYRQGEEQGERVERVSRNLERVAVTHDGALDVKDVLRFERLLFTQAAYDALAERLASPARERS